MQPAFDLREMRGVDALGPLDRAPEVRRNLRRPLGQGVAVGLGRFLGATRGLEQPGLEQQGREAERLEAQRDEFRAEREAFGTSATRREERLREREQALTRGLEQAARREQAWLDARERWRHEKQEAQEVVRGLLRELERAAAPEAIVYAAAPATDAAELPQFDERR